MPADTVKPARPAAAPERRCIASGEVAPKQGLLRFVVGPDGVLVPDLAERLPGRGLWLTADPALLRKAIAKNLFSKAARQHVVLPEDLEPRLAVLLRQRVLELLSLARRAGDLVAGHDKVRQRLETGAAALLLQAEDGAEDSCGRLARLAEGVRPGIDIYRILPAAELGAAIGREQAVHVAVDPGGLAERLNRELARYMALRDGGTVRDKTTESV
ncbi:MAG: RNA-binding protein [Rhodovibrionaceae bacterium]